MKKKEKYSFLTGPEVYKQFFNSFVNEKNKAKTNSLTVLKQNPSCKRKKCLPYTTWMLSISKFPISMQSNRIFLVVLLSLYQLIGDKFFLVPLTLILPSTCWIKLSKVNLPEEEKNTYLDSVIVFFLVLSNFYEKKVQGSSLIKSGNSIQVI